MSENTTLASTGSVEPDADALATVGAPSPAKRASTKAPDFGPELKGMVPDELKALLTSMGEAAFRADQVFQWLHKHLAADFDQMTNLKKTTREVLKDRYAAVTLELTHERVGEDGTIKYVFTARDGAKVEAVYIPMHALGTHTLCISSQVGCAMACNFCFTGTLKLRRHLHASEIVDQVYLAERALKARMGDDFQLSNLVYMGMGEPLHNFDATVRSANILMHEKGRNFSRRHITVSTSGLVPEIKRLGEALPVNLAVSLNATTDPLRDVVMPVNRKWPIAELLDACRHYPLQAGRRITFEYVLLAGENDSMDDADRLARLLKGIPAKVNLLAWNEVPGLPHKRPDDSVVMRFKDRLVAHHMTVFFRTSRGRDVMAACGMLGESVQ
jgi:23S rRNA (adenine2503-C2)-methyltransferase